MTNKFINKGYEQLLLSSLNVSRETFLTLENFVDLLLKWNEKINLIGRRSSELVWSKHVLPSAQLVQHIAMENPIILDVGSGAGFPGIVLSIIKGWKTVLVERNSKKCFFLKEAQSLTKANLVIENKTIAETNKFPPDIITSRGVTTIRNFLSLVDKFLNHRVQIMLMKGDKCQNEINEALEAGWHFDYQIKHNSSNEDSTIAMLSNFRKYEL